MVEHSTSPPIEITLRGDSGPVRETLSRLHLLRLAKLLHRSARSLLLAGEGLLVRLSWLPLVGTYVALLLERIDRRVQYRFDLSELLRVCSALESERLPFWVAGGWGLDVLVGGETRRHSDLDVVVDGFRENLAKVDGVLTGLGYHRKNSLGGIIWFPDATVYQDKRGHHIEVISINWNVLVAAAALLAPSGTPGLEPPLESTAAMSSLLARCTTTGELHGVAIPTLSVLAQRLFHLGFNYRPEDTLDDGVLRLLSSDRQTLLDRAASSDGASTDASHPAASTLLLVPIFSFPPELLRLCKLFHNDLDLIPPHVTLAFPFLPLGAITTELVEQLAEVIAGTSAFEFQLEKVAWFGTNVIYLEPSASEVFRSLIEDLQGTFPDFHPYDDAFASIVPHVTLSEHGSVADRRALGRKASKFLPFSARATHVWMMSNENHPDDWSIVEIFSLGPP